MVVQILGDDVAHPGQHEGHVGARANGQPHVGAGRIRREARVDDHGLHTGISQLRDHTARGADAVGGRAHAPHDVALGLAVGQVHLGHRTVGQRRVGGAVQAELHVVTGQVALGAARLEEVAAAPHGKEAGGAEELRVAATAGGAHERLRAFLLIPLPQYVGDLVYGLLPGDALPLVAAALAHELHGVFDAIGVVERLNASKAFGAGRPLVHGVVWIAFQLHYAAIAHMGDHAAIVEAGAADGANLLRLAAFGSAGRLHFDEVRSGRPGHGCNSGGEGAQLHETASADVRLSHCFLPFFSSRTVVVSVVVYGKRRGELGRSVAAGMGRCEDRRSSPWGAPEFKTPRQRRERRSRPEPKEGR